MNKKLVRKDLKKMHVFRKSVINKFQHKLSEYYLGFCEELKKEQLCV